MPKQPPREWDDATLEEFFADQDTQDAHNQIEEEDRGAMMADDEWAEEQETLKWWRMQ